MYSAPHFYNLLMVQNFAAGTWCLASVRIIFLSYVCRILPQAHPRFSESQTLSPRRSAFIRVAYNITPISLVLCATDSRCAAS